MVNPLIQELADKVESFCSRWYQNAPVNSLLVLVGGYGCGKTHTAKAVARFCRISSLSAFETKAWGNAQVPRTTFMPWPEIANEIAESKNEWLTDAIDCELLVLDDVGAENDPWKRCADKLCQILSRREKKFTILTTNIKPESWPAQFDGRITDRLLRNSVVVDLSSTESYAMRGFEQDNSAPKTIGQILAGTGLTGGEPPNAKLTDHRRP